MLMPIYIVLSSLAVVVVVASLVEILKFFRMENKKSQGPVEYLTPINKKQIDNEFYSFAVLKDRAESLEEELKRVDAKMFEMKARLRAKSRKR
jgi:hypothetical protein